jgi:hypothetical protein
MKIITPAFGQSHLAPGVLVKHPVRTDLGTGCVIERNGLKRKVSFWVKDQTSHPIPSFLPSTGNGAFPDVEVIEDFLVSELRVSR